MGYLSSGLCPHTIMSTKKIYILVGHPDKHPTLNSALADAYEKGAREAGHEVRRTHIADLSFDPVLHHGYREVQELELDLKKAQEDMRWADHYFLVYPNWWAGLPALLKGFFDRVWLPGFAFHFNDKYPFLWKKLLKGKTARVVITTDGAPLLSRILFGDNMNEIKKAILGFAGVRTSVTSIWTVKFRKESYCKRWFCIMEQWGRSAY